MINSIYETKDFCNCDLYYIQEKTTEVYKFLSTVRYDLDPNEKSIIYMQLMFWRNLKDLPYTEDIEAIRRGVDSLNEDAEKINVPHYLEVSSALITEFDALMKIDFTREKALEIHKRIWELYKEEISK